MYETLAGEYGDIVEVGGNVQTPEGAAMRRRLIERGVIREAARPAPPPQNVSTADWEEVTRVLEAARAKGDADAARAADLTFDELQRYDDAVDTYKHEVGHWHPGDELPEFPQRESGRDEVLISGAESLLIETYSDKSFVVRGDTKPFKDQLGRKGLGGKWNPKLRGGAGWIFKMEERGRVQEWMQGVKSGKTVAPLPATTSRPVVDIGDGSQPVAGIGIGSEYVRKPARWA